VSTQKPRPPGRRPKSRPFPSGAQGRTPPRDGDRGHRPPPPPPDTVYLWGTHAVVEALGSLRRKALRISDTEAAVERIAELAADRGVPVSIVPGDAISARLPRDAVHQGLLLEARRLEPIALDAVPDDGVVLVLDQITDPHNVGAILRTAAAFGVSALVLQDRHAPDLSGTLAKAASGGLEHVPVALVVNLARTLDKLGERGFFRVGLDSAGDGSLEAMDLPRPLALVLGSEGDGLRRLTRERCDAVARLDMPGPIKSLNVSIACAVALTVARLKAPAQ
jgi:23S rRNA (guanosine2251-2'-O)-methyltransferase